MLKKPQNNHGIFTAAKKYVDKQIATMKKHGGDPTLSDKAYRSLIQKIATVTDKATSKQS